MYGEQKLEISPNIAGLLCAAIISDTLMFRSPTCTLSDKMAAGALALIPIEFYNGERGINKFKMMFYWWYPLHLMVLYIIKCIVM